MERRIGWVRAVVSGAFVLFLAGAALADGVYIPPKAVETLPAIPRQRAFIRHRDGVETLVVESSLDSAGQTFGWILPVPDTPTAFAEASPGFLATLDLVFQPQIVQAGAGKGSGDFFPLLVVLACFVTGIGAIVIHSQRKASLINYLGLALFLLLLGAIATPTLMASKDAAWVSRPGAAVERHAFVGSYEVAAIRAETPRALQEWLAANGLNALPPAGERIAQDYIDDDWRFVVARLGRTTERGPMTPHPLAVTFPAERAVYPMRLTALPQSDVLVELFVAGALRVAHPRMETVFADRLRERLWHRYDEPPVEGLCGAHFTDAAIYHPATAEHLSEGDWLTRLRGAFPPGAMDADLVFTRIGTEPARQVFYTAEAAWWQGVIWALLAWSAGLPFVLFFSRLDLKAVNGRSWVLKRRVLPLLVFSLVLAAGVRLALPTAPVRLAEAAGKLPWRFAHQAEELAGALHAYLEGAQIAWRGMTPDELEDILRHPSDPDALAPVFAAHLREAGVYGAPDAADGIVRNPFTGEPLRIADAPGDFTLARDGGGRFAVNAPDGSEREVVHAGRLAVVWYDDAGRAHTFPVDPEAQE